MATAHVRSEVARVASLAHRDRTFYGAQLQSFEMRIHAHIYTHTPKKETVHTGVRGTLREAAAGGGALVRGVARGVGATAADAGQQSADELHVGGGDTAADGVRKAGQRGTEHALRDQIGGRGRGRVRGRGRRRLCHRVVVVVGVVVLAFVLVVRGLAQVEVARE